jgi:hypothetical protein
MRCRVLERNGFVPGVVEPVEEQIENQLTDLMQIFAGVN